MRAAARRKKELLLEMGGACQRCGYNRCSRALQFHHKDPADKDRTEFRHLRSVKQEEVKAHPERFELLCANCHFELHQAIDDARAVYRKCKMCPNQIKVEPALDAMGRGKYCSNACQASDRMSLVKPANVRFWNRVNKTETCWLWTATIDSKGYGFSNRNNKPMLVHRVSWEIHNGPIPQGMNVLHTCANPSCVRPDHLFLGTASDKMKEASKKGHTSRGERATWSKLTEVAVSDIRARYATGDISQADLAKEYGVSPATISECTRGVVWGHSFVAQEVPPKRRHAQGGNVGGSKLTDTAVIDIRTRAASGISQADLAEEYGVSRRNINNIVRGLVWKHLL